MQATWAGERSYIGLPTGMPVPSVVSQDTFAGTMEDKVFTQTGDTCCLVLVPGTQTCRSLRRSRH